jgi:hypothetical protein
MWFAPSLRRLSRRRGARRARTIARDMQRPGRLVLVAALATALLFGALVAGYSLALQRLQGAIEHGLGPRAEVGAVRAGLAGVEIERLRIRAERGWPAADELRAERIRIVPSLAGLWRGAPALSSVTVEGGYVSALRTRGGKLRLLPSLLESSTSAPLPALAIDEVRLVDGALDLYDASVRQPPHRLRIEGLQARAGPIALPALDAPVRLALHGVLKGPRHDGRIAIQGEVTPATRDARVEAHFAAVDLLALQPYLLAVADAGVKRGRLDLELKAKVERKHLHAPGVVTLTDLELANGNGMLARFAGAPRQAVLAAMRHDGRIRVAFTLDGRLDDPAFSLNENLVTRIASGLAESLGVSIEGVVQGVGNVVKGLLGR